MDAEILQQLIVIKWLSAAALATFLACLAVAAWTTIRLVRATKEMQTAPEFHEKARDLVEKGAFDEARTFTEERIASHPGDAYAYYYHGKACHQIGELTTALESLRKADELNPGWTDEYIAPLVATIEARMDKDEEEGPRN